MVIMLLSPAEKPLSKGEGYGHEKEKREPVDTICCSTDAE